MENIYGYRLITDPNLLRYHTREVGRTWRERLFTRPWRPWRPTRTETYGVPDEKFYFLDGTYYCHPEMAAKLRRAIISAVGAL
jgi:hypothetical protein